MKVVSKLTLAFLAGTSVVLAANGYVRVRREVSLFESDRARTHRLIGRALGASVSAVWQTDGQARALGLILDANADERTVLLRWTSAEGADRPHVPQSTLEPLATGGALTVTVPAEHGDPTRYTYVPVSVNGRRAGWIELSESLAIERAYVRQSIVNTALTTTLLALVCGLLSTLLGVWLVGRPMSGIIAKARKVGRGDFSGPLALTRNDELAELAREMNAMCDRLVEAHSRVASETSARLLALEQLRHADRLMTVGKLASGIAHELGTPLNVIGARAAMIAERETTPEEAVDYARVIVDSCERVTQVIRQLLDFARRREPEKAPCALGEVAARTIELLMPLAVKRDIALTLSSSSEAVTVLADASQLQQVLTNLIVNAMQASAAATEVQVSVAVERVTPPVGHAGADDRCAVLRVLDAGAGIAPEHVSHVFEPFFTTKDVGEGTGLGLAVAYGLVQEHGGWITVQSEVGKGSEFAMCLPLLSPP